MKCRPGKTRPCGATTAYASFLKLLSQRRSKKPLLINTTHLILHFLTEPDHSALLAINAHHEFLFQWQKGILLQILLIEICIEPHRREKSKISRKFQQIATSRTMRNVSYEITLRNLKLQKHLNFAHLIHGPWRFLQLRYKEHLRCKMQRCVSSKTSCWGLKEPFELFMMGKVLKVATIAIKS